MDYTETQKEFYVYLRVKEFMRKNDYDETDLMKKIQDRRPALIPLIIRSDDMEPRKYEHLSAAANDIKASQETLIYVY